MKQWEVKGEGTHRYCCTSFFMLPLGLMKGKAVLRSRFVAMVTLISGLHTANTQHTDTHTPYTHMRAHTRRHTDRHTHTHTHPPGSPDQPIHWMIAVLFECQSSVLLIQLILIKTTLEIHFEIRWVTCSPPGGNPSREGENPDKKKKRQQFFISFFFFNYLITRRIQLINTHNQAVMRV